MATDLAKFAKENGIKYFMISFTDLFGGQRAKLVPARAIAGMQEDGAGFAGFATWLDLTPAHPDMLAVPQGKRMNHLGDRPTRLTSTNSSKKSAFPLIPDKRIVSKTPHFNKNPASCVCPGEHPHAYQ